MKLSSNRIALGGMFTALCVMILLLGGLIGIGTYAAPMLGGICTLFVIIKADIKTAVLQWLASGLLCIFLSADKELAIVYLLIFGWYPILKHRFTLISNTVLRIIVKLSVFNCTAVLSYLLMWALLFGFDWSVSGYGSRLMTFLYLIIGNIIFALYDRVLTIIEHKFAR